MAVAGLDVQHGIGGALVQLATNWARHGAWAVDLAMLFQVVCVAKASSAIAALVRPVHLHVHLQVVRTREHTTAFIALVVRAVADTAHTT